MLECQITHFQICVFIEWQTNIFPIRLLAYSSDMFGLQTIAISASQAFIRFMACTRWNFNLCDERPTRTFGGKNNTDLQSFADRKGVFSEAN
jgi:hypothetical protein